MTTPPKAAADAEHDARRLLTHRIVNQALTLLRLDGAPTLATAF